MAETKTEIADVERTKPPKERMSLEEFLKWADEDVWAEWEDGEVIVMSPASYQHQDISRFLTVLLSIFLEEHDLGIVLSAPFAMWLPISNRLREPDLMVVLKEHHDRIKEAYLDGPADLVIEIVSSESILRDRGTKFAEYELDGVREYWVIDPERKQADFFVLGEGGRYERGMVDKKGFYRSSILKGFRIKVDWLWQSPLPKVTEALKEVRRRSPRKR